MISRIPTAFVDGSSLHCYLIGITQVAFDRDFVNVVIYVINKHIYTDNITAVFRKRVGRAHETKH